MIFLIVIKIIYSGIESLQNFKYKNMKDKIESEFNEIDKRDCNVSYAYLFSLFKFKITCLISLLTVIISLK